MISHKHQFIFVHIPKTGGKSVRKALRPFTLSPLQRSFDYLSTRTIRRDIFEIDPAGSHASAVATHDVVGVNLFSDYFVFSMVRNPWALVVSEYYFIRKRPASPYYKVATEDSLEAYLDLRFSDGQPTQLHYLKDGEKRWMVDYIGLTENSKRDFGSVCQKLNINAALPHKNLTRHRDYREEHTDESRRKVAEYFAGDIAVFGYDFDNPDSGIAPSSVDYSLRNAMG